MNRKSFVPGDVISLRLLKIVLAVSPALFVVLLALCKGWIFQGTTPTIADGLFFAAVAIFTIVFYTVILRLLKRTGVEESKHKHELTVLNEMAMAVNSSLDLNVMLPNAMEKLIQVTGSDSGQLSLIGEKSNEPSYTLCVGTPKDGFKLAPTSTANGGRQANQVTIINEPIIIGDAKGSENPFAPALLSAGFRSLAIVPLKSRIGNVGVFSLASCKPHHFKTKDLSLLANVAGQMAVAIENVRLHENLQGAVVAEERERIAKELHDGLAQVLGYVITKSQATRQILSKMAVANDYLVELEDVAQNVYTDTREDILGLRTAVSADRDLVSVLREFLVRFNQMHGIRTTLEAGDQPLPGLSPQVQLQAIRIVQEALSNVRKHAQATLALVKVVVIENELILTVEDDGKGFDIGELDRSSPSKFGIRTIKERAESIRARLDIDSQPGHGTRVTLIIPVP